jgi:uncharacterized SAM-binding protein YcdF (DUF218 family)
LVNKGPFRLVLALGLLLVLALGACNAGSLLVVRHPLERPDAIISLASHEWERLPRTANLALANPAALVVLTIPQPATVENCYDCNGRLARLQHLGIPSDRVRTILLTSPGTYGEALATLALVTRTPIRRLLIVTTPYHTRRSLATFRSVLAASGVEVGVEPADSNLAQPGRWWATPYDREYVSYEWAALVYYALRYQIVPWS